MVEYKWKSLEEFNKYPKSWFRPDTYSEDWRPLMFGNKFINLKAAIQSIDQFIKVAQSWRNSDISKGWRDDTFGKYYRVRNMKTNEIFEYKNNNDETN